MNQIYHKTFIFSIDMNDFYYPHSANRIHFDLWLMRFSAPKKEPSENVFTAK